MTKQKTLPGSISPTGLGEFSQNAMRAYGSYVLMDRAVADVRDGLKPVQRRILWSLQELNSSGFKKSAKVVGVAMGNYHPHGDASIYETLVNLVGDRYPMIEGHGNFGSATDPAASSRYTECRLTPLAQEMFKDTDVGTFVPNYSGDMREPLVLPSRLPLLLLNGSSGIGVALRTSIPPHNLKELIRVLVYYITKPEPSLSTVCKHMPGPDYGYGVLLSPPEEVKTLYETGKGTLHFRCEYEFETTKKTGSCLVVTSLAPGFNLSSFLTKMKGFQEAGLIEFCSDATSASGIKVYVGFKDAQILRDRVLPELFTTQSYQFYVVKRENEEYCLDDKSLFSGGLFRLFQEFLDFRRSVETLRLGLELRVAKANLSRSKAILAAIDNLPIVYATLQETHLSVDSIRAKLATALSISEKQAQLVLDMKVHQLARMNRQTQVDKMETIHKQIESIKEDSENIDGVIVRHLKELLPFSDARGTKLASDTPIPTLSVRDIKKFVTVSGDKVSRSTKEPSRRKTFDYVTQASSNVSVVMANNEVKTLSLSFFSEEQMPYRVVGLVSDSSSLLCAVDSSGKAAIVNYTPKSAYTLMKGATEIVSAVGVDKEGRVAFVSHSGKGKLFSGSSLTGTRPFSLGKSLLKDHNLTDVFSIPKGSDLFDSTGKCITLELFEGTAPFFVIGESNFVVTKSEDKLDILTYKETVSLLKSKELKNCWIL